MANFEDEWVRVKSNPPNVILSEELRAMLPDIEDDVTARRVTITAKINFAGENEIEGSLLTFTKSAKAHKYIIECAAIDAVGCLGEYEIETISFKSNIDDREFFATKSPDEMSVVSVEFYTPTNSRALLTAIICSRDSELISDNEFLDDAHSPHGA